MVGRATVGDQTAVMLGRDWFDEFTSGLVEYHCFLFARLQYDTRARHIYYYTATMWLDRSGAVIFRNLFGNYIVETIFKITVLPFFHSKYCIALLGG